MATSTDHIEATEILSKVREVFVKGGGARLDIETSVGTMKFSQITDTFASLMPEDSHYITRAGNPAEQSGVGLHLSGDEETKVHHVVTLIRRMRRSANSTAAFHAARAA